MNQKMEVIGCAVAASAWCAVGGILTLAPGPPPATAGPGESRPAADARPAPCPERWRGLLGHYGPGDSGLLIRERAGRLEALVGHGPPETLEEEAPGILSFPRSGPRAGATLTLELDPTGVARSARLGDRALPRRGTVEGAVFRIQPRRPVADLRQEARAASPPREPGPFRPVDLVDVSSLAPGIRLDVRYATSRNFLGTPVYPAARALLQRPAAEALARAHRSLAARGLGLLVHDAYRPWWVTRLFWDATPPDKRSFVARPDRGSRHNRGAAVDLTLCSLESGAAVTMPGVYDEMSERSHPDYPGGTSLQRWHRDLLRAAMEAEGFTVFEVEWWHFDFRGWPEYPLLNVPFESLDASPPGERAAPGP